MLGVSNHGVPEVAEIVTFYDAPTGTATHVVICVETKECVVIDPVWNYEAASGRLRHGQVHELDKFVRERNLTCKLVLDTHMHADHITAGNELRELWGAKYGIGAKCQEVQEYFKKMFELDWLAADMSQFDLSLKEGDRFTVGKLEFVVFETPGHTPGCLSYYCEMAKALFVGDTVFMPDSGSARCDFPGGSASTLYRSVRRLLSTAPADTYIYSGHDYSPGGRQVRWSATVAEQLSGNIHVREEMQENDFVHLRTTRDSTLSFPGLLLTALQMNINAGRLPPPSPSGSVFLKIPLTVIKD